MLKDLKDLKEELQNFKPVSKHDNYVKEAIFEAIKAAEKGNFGVGAVLVDNRSGEIFLKGHNKVFSEDRSDLHAEMDVMNSLENLYKSKSRDVIKNSTIVTSLECCPMCFSRLITSGINKVFYAAKDETGGMIHLKDNMPSKWKELMAGRTFEQAECSPKLQLIADKVFMLTIDLNNKINPPEKGFMERSNQKSDKHSLSI